MREILGNASTYRLWPLNRLIGQAPVGVVADDLEYLVSWSHASCGAGVRCPLLQGAVILERQLKATFEDIQGIDLGVFMQKREVWDD